MTIAHLSPAGAAFTPIDDEVAVDDQTFGRIALVALVGNLVFIASLLIAYGIHSSL